MSEEVRESRHDDNTGVAGTPFTIRPWREGDEIALTRLFHRTFGRPITPEHWRWKLRPEPHGFDNVWLALNEGEPIFQYAGIPVQFNLAGKPVQVVVSVDTMTAPEFRRRGLLTQVAQIAYSAWRAAGVACVIGLPNENWGTRAQALGWRSLFPLQWLVRPVRPQAILAARMKWPALKRLRVMESLWNVALKRRVRPSPDIHLEQVEQAGPDFDQTWARCKTDWAFSTVRDRRWVNWRFMSAPARTYKLLIARRQGEPMGYLSYAIVHTADRVSAYLAEVCVGRADTATRDSLLAGVLELVRAADAESVHVLAIPGTMEFSCLRRAGFLAGHAFDVQFVPLQPDLPIERMLDRQQWNLSGADFDVV